MKIQNPRSRILDPGDPGFRILLGSWHMSNPAPKRRICHLPNFTPRMTSYFPFSYWKHLRRQIAITMGTMRYLYCIALDCITFKGDPHASWRLLPIIALVLSEELCVLWLIRNVWLHLRLLLKKSDCQTRPPAGELPSLENVNVRPVFVVDGIYFKLNDLF